LAVLYETVARVRITASFAASSTLAKQIEAGAPADIFLSANPRWMDYLETGGHLIEGSRRDLVGNRIVLIAPEDSPLGNLKINAELDILHLLEGHSRLAMGDPAHVPAGLYAKQALQTLGLWETVANRLAPMADVRAALTLVERGETPLGLVYATDAAISERVKVVGTFPAGSRSPSTPTRRYPGAKQAHSSFA
jgi:molybdate transport system substrate-binding protein